jgi:hypothetical protein
VKGLKIRLTLDDHYLPPTPSPSTHFQSLAMRYTAISLAALATALLCIFGASSANGESSFTTHLLRKTARTQIFRDFSPLFVSLLHSCFMRYEG